MQTLLDKVIEIANDRYDGHVTIMKFTTGWKVVFGTPDFHGTEDYESIRRMPGGRSLDAALWDALALPDPLKK